MALVLDSTVKSMAKISLGEKSNALSQKYGFQMGQRILSKYRPQTSGPKQSLKMGRFGSGVDTTMMAVEVAPAA